LEIRVDGTGSPTTAGVVGRLIAKQPHVRHLVLAAARSARTLDHRDGAQVSFEMNRAYGAALSAVNGGGGGGGYGGDDNVAKLAACERLDVRASVADWHGWFPDLLARLPCLTCLECHEFPARFVGALLTGAPQLIALRIERQDFLQRKTASEGWTPRGRFVHVLLASLGRLRSLALPYATVHLADLSVAADRLESLEARNLVPSATIPPEAVPPTFAMLRLTHLTTSMIAPAAAEILGCMPHVRSGQLSFEANHDNMWTSVLMAHLDTKRDDNESKSGATGGGDAQVARANEKACGGDCDSGSKDGTSIFWSSYPDGEEPGTPVLAADVCRAMRKLHTFAASVHDFDSSVGDATRLGIETYLKEMREADAAIAVATVVAKTSGAPSTS
jgi:hypothetical protein